MSGRSPAAGCGCTGAWRRRSRRRRCRCIRRSWRIITSRRARSAGRRRRSCTACRAGEARAGGARLRGRGRALRARARGAGDGAARRRGGALRRAAGARRGSLAGQRARPARDVPAGASSSPAGSPPRSGSPGRRSARAAASTPRWRPIVAYVGLLEEALTALEPGRQRAARAGSRAAGREPRLRAAAGARRELGAARRSTMARRLGEPGALVAALMGRHAALLHAGHARERRRIGEEALALAGELEARELAALARHWLLYDLAELGDLEEARAPPRRARAARRRAPAAALPAFVAGLARRLGGARRPLRRGRAARARVRPPGRRRRRSRRASALHGPARRHATRTGPTARTAAGDRAPRRSTSPRPPRGRSLLPLAYLDAGDRGRAQLAYQRALGDAGTMPRRCSG